MATQILMPALSPTMTEGKLSRWLKHVGDEVHAGDVIAEIETDKATMEVEAVDEGKLAEILVPEGTDGVKVNTPIALLQGDDETIRPLALLHELLEVCPSRTSLGELPQAAMGLRYVSFNTESYERRRIALGLE